MNAPTTTSTGITERRRPVDVRLGPEEDHVRVAPGRRRPRTCSSCRPGHVRRTSPRGQGDGQPERRPAAGAGGATGRPGTRPTCRRSRRAGPMLVKNVRNRTWAGNQRMQASSRNRISPLTRNRSRAGRVRVAGSVPAGRDTAGGGVTVVSVMRRGSRAVLTDRNGVTQHRTGSLAGPDRRLTAAPAAAYTAPHHAGGRTAPAHHQEAITMTLRPSRGGRGRPGRNHAHGAPHLRRRGDVAVQRPPAVAPQGAVRVRARPEVARPRPPGVASGSTPAGPAASSPRTGWS